MKDHKHDLSIDDKTKQKRIKFYNVRLRKESSLAFLSAFLGVIGLGCFVFLGIPAMVCGFAALVKFKREPDGFKGAWMAVVGILFGFIGTIIDVIHWIR